MARTIPLTRGLAATVDDEDFERLAQWSWYAQPGANTFYAARREARDAKGKRRTRYMHREVLGLGWYEPGGPECDHRNRDGLDNRRENLRVVTHQENARNRDNHRLPDRLCETCGASFAPGRSAARFCSQRCFGLRANNPRTARILPDRRCPTCGGTFRPWNHRTTFCSLSCRRR